MPQWLEYPLKSRRDWEERFLPRLDPTSPGRYPAGWRDQLGPWRARTTPLGMRMGSIYGMLRNWMGLEGISLAVYDDQVWVAEMMSHMAEFACGCGARALRDLDLDYILIWEDMAGKNGLFLSPGMIRGLMLAPYRRLTGFIKDHGVDLIFADSDGMIDALLPLWIEGGVTGIYPLERAAGMDPVSVRRKYGPGLRMIGGVDKRALAIGGSAIDDQVAHVRPLLQEGGYVAWCDHFVPPDVSLSNYRHYKNRVRGIVATPRPG